MAVSYEASGKVILFGAAADEITDFVKVDYMRWIKSTTAGHGLVIHNQNGEVIAQRTADAGNKDQKIELRTWINGITVDTMTSGTLEVHLL